MNFTLYDVVINNSYKIVVTAIDETEAKSLGYSYAKDDLDLHPFSVEVSIHEMKKLSRPRTDYRPVRRIK